MKGKTRKDVVDRIAKRIYDKVDHREHDVYKSDIRVVVNLFIEECRNIVLEGNNLILHDLVTIHIEDTAPKTVHSKFCGKQHTYHLKTSKAVRATPSYSLRAAVRRQYNHTVDVSNPNEQQ